MGTYAYTYTYTCTYTYAYTYTYVYVKVYAYVCICVCVCVCLCLCVYACIYMYVYVGFGVKKIKWGVQKKTVFGVKKIGVQKKTCLAFRSTPDNKPGTRPCTPGHPETRIRGSRRHFFLLESLDSWKR